MNTGPTAGNEEKYKPYSPAWIGDGYDGAGTKSFRVIVECSVNIGIVSLVWFWDEFYDLEMMSVPGEDVDESAL